MIRRQMIRFTTFILFAISISTVSLHAQAPSGYVKIASTTSTTYTDTNVSSGDVWNYVVTATNVAGESGPSNVLTETTPVTQVAHLNTIAWTSNPGGSPATGYNVYRAPGEPPSSPID